MGVKVAGGGVVKHFIDRLVLTGVDDSGNALASGRLDTSRGMDEGVTIDDDDMLDML